MQMVPGAIYHSGNSNSKVKQRQQRKSMKIQEKDDTYTSA